ncbi:MAG TPA: hypothetical protein VD963_00405 [Phycisphaerales bacterium]|nr:hypothetical protein [Phycisphaerales bacterium]
MSERLNRVVRGGAGVRAVLLAGVLTLGLVGVPAICHGQTGTKEKPASKEVDPATLDTLIFHTGRTVQGHIIEETATSVKFKLIGAGGLSTEVTYPKSDILSIQKAATKPEADAQSKPGETKPGETKPGDEAGPKGTPGKVTGEPISEGTKRIYLVTLKGEFGRDVSATPLRAVMADARKFQPDVLIFKIDCDFKYLGEERPDWMPADAGPAFNQLETAREVSTLITDDVRDDAQWKTRDGKKPRLVMWVKKALGGVAFLPFIAPEIYYTSDGRHGGIGYLDRMFEGVGDKVVQEKQYSLRLGRAEGLAIKGGHDPRLVRAMSRVDYVLSVSFVGGKPVFHENDTGELLLTDDGEQQYGRLDTMQDVVRFRGNDVLTLDAEWAYKLGLSNGTADTIEDLAFQLGIGRDYVVESGKSERVLTEWGKAVTEAERDFGRLWREFGRTPVQGEYEERARGRGKRIQILMEIKALLDRYREAINPREIEGAPDDWETQINLMIEQLKQEQRRDRR